MKELKPHSIEWLDFARSIGATHWHTKGHFYRINSAQRLVIYTRNGWEPRFYDPELLNDRELFSKIDFSPLDNKLSSQEPDWSKAPEGATHWAPETDEDFAVWYKCEAGVWFFALDSESIWHPHDDGGLPRTLIQRPTVNQQLTVPVVSQEFTTEKVVSSKMEPTTWNGTGRPPVGTVCEANHFGEWIECKIEKHLNDGDNVDIIYSYDNGARWEYSDSSEHFRPIKSDRERWIIEAKKASKHILSSSQLGGIYDAGLAKLPE